LTQDSFNDNFLTFPQFTRPAEFRGMKVPEVLLSGDHAAIERWREEERRRQTRLRRPDLNP
jgi:tRNA (guanine37-N1)-methyltransferase